MTQEERERRAREIAALGWEGAAQLPIQELDLVAFGLNDGLQRMAVEDIEIWDMDNWETAQAEVDAAPSKWLPHLDKPLEVDLEDGMLKLRDGHHRLYTAQLQRVRDLPVYLEIKDNPIRRIMAWVEDPSRFELNPEYRRIKRRLMR